MKKKNVLLTLGVLTMFTITACKQTDVVGKQSIKSFEQVLNKVADKVTTDEEFGGWALSAPDETARFLWSKDLSLNSSYDAMIEFDAKPFIEAGLDTSKLPEGYVSGDKILVGTDYGDESITNQEEATPIESYKKIVDIKRDAIDYHAALDHYGISLSDGNVFEWAKDITKNDKDIVFALNPQVFIDAGADPDKIEGWVFAKVETMDKKGKKVEVDKLLKPFDLK